MDPRPRIVANGSRVGTIQVSVQGERSADVPSAADRGNIRRRLYDPLDWHREQGHQVAAGPGLFPEADQAAARAVEIWREAQAYADEAARALVAGRIDEARTYAQRSRRLAAEHDDFDGWSMTVKPPADRPSAQRLLAGRLPPSTSSTSGSGTTGVAALQLGRQYIGIDLHEPYNQAAAARLAHHSTKENHCAPGQTSDPR